MQPRPNTFTELLPCDAARSLDGWEIIDVREPDEFHGDLGHLPGAALVPLRGLDQPGPWSRSARLLVVCRSGRRSRAACEQLVAQGFTAVANLEGGVIGWAARGLPLCGHRHTSGCCHERLNTGALEARC
jgi:rhodanese-related sulfurtransferase